MDDASPVAMPNSKSIHYCDSKKKNEVGFFGQESIFFSNYFHPKNT